ncbi:MAG: N-6 DNA methylase [Anaerolineales bacterium]|nr:N-6 DNA methylase [Anaerolineales bacterium]
MREKTVKSRKVKEQLLLLTDSDLLPEILPTLSELKPAENLSAVFDDCHNYIYANEGMLKDKIFHEMVKILVMKLHDEQNNNGKRLEFGITSSEHRLLLSNSPSPFEERLARLYMKVQKEHSKLFLDDGLRLKPLTLAFVVNQLQYISLTSTPGDIKGEAFQTFVYRHQRGDRGEFFTPFPIVRLAVEMIDPQPHERIIDPACGSGGFLIQALSYVLRENPTIQKSKFIIENVSGLEFNPDVALATMIRMAFEGGSGDEIVCLNSLSDSDDLNGKFDIILTNPPFGAKGKVETQKILKSYVLARKWKQLPDGGWEPSKVVLSGQSPDILFIEKSLKLLKPGGRMAIVLPDGLLQNVSSAYVRYWLKTQTKVLAVISIPQEAFIPYGTGIKTSLLVLQKLPSEQTANSCFMTRIEKIGYDVKGQPIYKKNGSNKFAVDSFGSFVVDDDVDEISNQYRTFRNNGNIAPSNKVYPVPESLLNSRLDAEHYHPDDLEFIERLRRAGAKPLGELADFVTKANDFKNTDEEIRYIAISDVDARTMQVVSQQSIIAHDAPSRASYRVVKGDIITATAGASTGTYKQATALITEDEDGAICSNGFAVIRNIRGINPFFLLAYLRTEYFLKQVRRLMTGHAIPAISLDDLSKVLVPVPPKDEQNRMAEEIAVLQNKRKEAIKLGEKLINDAEKVVTGSLV